MVLAAGALALPAAHSVNGRQPEAVTPGAAKIAAGKQSFQKCYACHSLDGPDPAAQGPSLKGIVGRKVAAEPGFAYSPALRAYALRQPRWSRGALDAFLADPHKLVPGNEMGFFGIRDPDERGALITYLLAH